VLVVDDNEDAAHALAALVSGSGHEARVAFDGRSAVEICDHWGPDLVILDLGLPGMDGFDVATEIRRLARDGAPPPRLVALSGHGAPADHARSKAVGFDEHLVKPPPLSVLARVLRGNG
jgi:CheY-like chemotaxis protein